MPQLSTSGRIVTVVGVSQGQCFYANSGDTAWTLATNNTGQNPPLAYTGVVQSSALNQKLWFADGSNWVYFNPADGSVNNWTLSAGTQLPQDSAGNKPRLICTWRDSIVLSGMLKDGQNWVKTGVGDATNFNYAPVPWTVAAAVIGQNAPQGLIGDNVTALIPYSNDVLIFGGDHSIYQMSGDPNENGHLDLISDSIGMAWGTAWCKDPYGNVYFFSNKTGIYSFLPGSGQKPLRVSMPIEQLVTGTDTGLNTITMAWDDKLQGLHVFITPTAQVSSATHLFFEQRSGAWWQDKFANNNHNPLCTCVFDGNTPGDRVVLIGSWDGYVRSISSTATTDDGTAISSQVVLGPILTPDADDMLLKDIQGILGTASGSVTYSIYVGRTAEEAIASTPIETGTLTAGRNATSYTRTAAHAVYVGLSTSNPWAMEEIKMRVSGLGKVRRRAPY